MVFVAAPYLESRNLGSPSPAVADVVVAVIGVTLPLLLLPAAATFALAFGVGAVGLVRGLWPRGESAATGVAGFLLHKSLLKKTL